MVTIQISICIQESVPDSKSPFRIPKSAFTGLSIKFDEILWRARVQLFTFWRRSASLSRSGSPFRITITIRKELTLSTHTEQTPCENHSAILLCWRSAEVCALRILLVLLVASTKAFSLQVWGITTTITTTTTTTTTTIKTATTATSSRIITFKTTSTKSVFS